MNGHDELRQRMESLKSAAPHAAGPLVEERVMSAFRARRGRRARIWAYWAAAAASLAVLAIYLLGHLGQPGRRLPGGGTSMSAPAGFVALPYAESGVPLEEAIIVRVRLESSQLGKMGMPITAANQGRKVNADLLVGQDGVPRAVRLVE